MCIPIGGSIQAIVFDDTYDNNDGDDNDGDDNDNDDDNNDNDDNDV